MHKRQLIVVLYAEQQFNKLLVWRIYSKGWLIVFRRVGNVFRKFCLLRVGQFCESFENTRENLSLILLGLIRLHILTLQSTPRPFLYQINYCLSVFSFPFLRCFLFQQWKPPLICILWHDVQRLYNNTSN